MPYDSWKLAAPEQPELQVPPDYVNDDEYRAQVYDAAQDALRPLAKALGTYGRGWTRVSTDDLTNDEASVELRIPVHPPASRQWHDGADTYYLWDAADYDVRPDLVAQLARVIGILQRDIAERPLL